jgi:hypothetical protein
VAERLEMKGKPGRKRSPLWQYEAEIRRLFSEGWTYPQIAEGLERAGAKVSLNYLREWGAQHIGRVRGQATQPPAPAPIESAAAAAAAESKSEPVRPVAPAAAPPPGAGAADEFAALESEMASKAGRSIPKRKF